MEKGGLRLFYQSKSPNTRPGDFVNFAPSLKGQLHTWDSSGELKFWYEKEKMEGEGEFIQRKNVGYSFFSEQKKGARSLLVRGKMRGKEYFLEWKRGGVEFSLQTHILKTRPGYLVNFGLTIISCMPASHPFSRGWYPDHTRFFFIFFGLQLHYGWASDVNGPATFVSKTA